MKKSEIKQLKKILKKYNVPKQRVKGVLAYLSVCFLAYKIDAVADFFNSDYVKVRNVITKYHFRWKKNHHFRNFLFRVTNDYKELERQTSLKLVG